MSFTFFLFIFVYFIPLFILITSNTITLIGLKRMREKIKHGIHTVLNRRRIEMERRIVKSKNLFSKNLNDNFSSSHRCYYHHMWFHYHLDSLCYYIICFSIPWQRLCYTTINYILLCLFC